MTTTAALPDAPFASVAPGTLPDLTFPVPSVASVEWEIRGTILRLGASGDVVERSLVVRYAGDFADRVGSMDMLFDGEPVTSIVSTDQFVFESAQELTDPWVRVANDGTLPGPRPHDPGSLTLYQSAVSQIVREMAQGVRHATSTVAGEPVTVFSFASDVRYSTPNMIDQEFTADAALYVGDLSVSVDDTGLVRRLTYVLDASRWREVLLATGHGQVLVDFELTVTSLDEPVTIAIPTDLVDEDTFIGEMNLAACDADFRTMQVVAEAWMAMHPGTPVPSEAELIEAGLLRSESDRYDITPDGVVVPAPGSPCQ